MRRTCFQNWRYLKYLFTERIDSFWKNKPTFVQPAHVVHINETKFESANGRRQLIQQREERRSIEAKIAAQCAIEASVARVKKRSTSPKDSPPSKPFVSQYFEDSHDQEEQLLQHAATMLLFTQAVAKERSRDSSAGLTNRP
jgi:hypothetical protein